jgi:hypothetical protein
MKDPAVLFYTQDFLTGTLLMNYEQKGKYITLLCIQQQNGKLSEKDLMKVCGEKDEDIWAKFQIGEDGFYYNGRMLIETSKRKKFTESRLRNLSHMDSHMEICNKKDEISNKKEEEFKGEVFAFSEKYPLTMLQAFLNYWIEKSKAGKMRYEGEKYFDMSRRLSTWAKNDKEFNKIEKTQELITYRQLCDKVSNGETDAFDLYERMMVNGKAMYKRKIIKQ